MKKIVGVLCVLAALAGSAFAADAKKNDIGFYAKGTLGYASITYSEGIVSETISHFELAPVFGVTGLVPVPHFAIEGFCNLDFGAKDYGLATVKTTFVVPGARAVWAPPISFFSGKTGTWQDQLIPYAGAGFSVPICFMNCEYTDYNIDYTTGKTTKTKVSIDDSKAYFDMEIQLGCRWAFNDKVAVLAEQNFCFGGVFKYSFTAGAMYTFK